MKNFDKKIFIYAFFMIIAVLIIIGVAYLSEMKMDIMEDDFENQISVQEEKTELFQEKIKALEEKNKELEEENKKLKNEKNSSFVTASNNETYQQAMKHLSDIYLLIESGNKKKAADELKKFDVTTFDDTVINYKKALLNLID